MMQIKHRQFLVRDVLDPCVKLQALLPIRCTARGRNQGIDIRMLEA
jgi:hypothetical protein